MSDERASDGESGMRPTGAGSRGEALAGRRAEAVRALAEVDGHVAALDSWIGAVLEAMRVTLGSRRWKLGDLLVHRIGKRLLRRPNLAAPWAPERAAALGEELERWRLRRRNEPGAAGQLATSPEPPRRDLEALLADLDESRAHLPVLASWLEKSLAAHEQIVASSRYRVGETLIGRAADRLPGGTAVSRARARVEETRASFAEWTRGPGHAYFGAFAGGETGPPPLGPPGRRPRVESGSRRVGFQPVEGSARGVSLIVLNRDGAAHLHNLLASFAENNRHPEVEILIVDHDSSDDSRAVAERFAAELPVRLLPFAANHSFSHGNNRGAEAAAGRYLFFLNNDILFDRDVLPGLIERLERSGAGAVGATLRYPPYYEISPGGIQHAGIRFRPDPRFHFFRPFNLTAAGAAGESTEPSPAVTGAALFCRRRLFLETGGFDEGYVYGYEDVDLCLGLRARGHLSVVARDLELTHDESATQRTQSGDELRRRRRGNISRLARRFGYAVKRGWWGDLVAGERFWTDRPLEIGFAVDDRGPEARAGDFFTASELARACERQHGWRPRFLARQDLEADWYNVAGLDVLVVMLDLYDLRRLRLRTPGLIKVAWMRNWFDRWAARPWFDDFDLFLCSSERAARYLREEHGKPARVLRIATDPERFTPGEPSPELASDYCFTGSYWNAERDLEGLRPGRIDADFALFGQGWDDHARFRRHRRGFVPYREIHEVYRSTRIVIDDANHATKPWGSVNSRVFDALAAGALVVTNGRLGAEEAFDGALPGYETPAELEELVRRYLEDEDARRRRVKELRAVVLRRHTYDHRAAELGDILADFVGERFRIAIKVPCPRAEEKHRWGDYHMAVALGRRFERAGHAVRIDLLPDWDTPEGVGDDLVFVFRGLSRYEPKPAHINLIWNITHPERVPDEELEAYDHVFVASAEHARALSGRLEVGVSELLQCADPEVFRPGSGADAEREVLFVGNSRRQARPIVTDAIAAGLPLTVFGAMWEGLIEERRVEGEHIPNEDLHRFYGGAGVVLNDHWPSMSEHGFLSNRLFDAGACGACVVSDRAAGLEEVFGDAIETYDGTSADLRRKVEALLAAPERRREMGERLRRIVLDGHTFEHRAEEILAVATRHHRRRLRGLVPAASTAGDASTLAERAVES